MTKELIESTVATEELATESTETPSKSPESAQDVATQKATATTSETAESTVTTEAAAATDAPSEPTDPKSIALNKYLALSGVCSRRKALDIIVDGEVSVNNATITEPFHLVSETDTVRFRKKVVRKEGKIYLVVNKPSKVLTTCSDPSGRPIILDLVRRATKKRLFHIGRLDFLTTGAIILTNDGELSEKLSHPRYNIRKIYRATLHKPLAHDDLMKMRKGVRLKDGHTIKMDHVTSSNTGKIVSIEIHSGKNRIIRKVFDKLGYHLKKLDRLAYGPISKKNILLGRWRYLTRKEIEQLKKL